MTLGVFRRLSASRSRIILPKRKVATVVAIGRNISNNFQEPSTSNTLASTGIRVFLMKNKNILV